MPMTDKDNVYVNITYNKDTSLENNQKMTSELYRYILEFFDKKHPGVVKNVELNLGQLYSQSALDNTVYRTSFNPELAEFNVVLKSTEDRDEKDNAVLMFPELNAFLKEKTKSNPELQKKISDLTVFIQKNGPSGGKDVTFNISASGATDSEIKLLAREYDKILPELQKIPGTYGWSSSLAYTNGKINILYDTDKLSQLGLTA
jgi:multidrug efflux pump subunit AcrB